MFGHRLFAATLLVSAALVVPSSAQAGQERTSREDIRIEDNRDFTRVNGVRSGRGTARDPYVISGWDVHSIEIADTGKAIRIVDNKVHNLTLNWNGPMVEVRDNDIGDLRVNENVERTGAPTSGLITKNTFGSVSQIRHFDGRFSYNTVGSPDGDFFCQAIIFCQELAVNFDGFNGASFDHNTLYGALDARLHGHHHSSGFGRTSHMHSYPAGHAHHPMVDHAKRYHTVSITQNTIYAKGDYALAYLDTNHSGNDRTANSESEESLNDPHVHFTRVAITRNKLIGAGMVVDVFNAEDELHRKMATGALEISRNSIVLAPKEAVFVGPTSGINVVDARYLHLTIAWNSITGPPPSNDPSPIKEWFESGEGINLNRLDHGHVMIEGNSVTNRVYGVYASDMTESVHWTVRGLRTSGVQTPVAYSDSVKNPPARR